MLAHDGVVEDLDPSGNWNIAVSRESSVRSRPTGRMIQPSLQETEESEEIEADPFAVGAAVDVPVLRKQASPLGVSQDPAPAAPSDEWAQVAQTHPIAIRSVDDDYLDITLTLPKPPQASVETSDVDVTGPPSPEVQVLLKEASQPAAKVPGPSDPPASAPSSTVKASTPAAVTDVARSSSAPVKTEPLTVLRTTSLPVKAAAPPTALGSPTTGAQDDDVFDPSVPEWKRSILRKRRSQTSSSTEASPAPLADDNPHQWRTRLRTSTHGSRSGVHGDTPPLAGVAMANAGVAAVPKAKVVATTPAPAKATVSTNVPLSLQAEPNKTGPAGLLASVKQKTYSQEELAAMPPWKREVVLRNMRKTAV